MPLFDNQPFQSIVQSPDASAVLTSMLLSTLIALVISQIYKYTHRGMNFELSFMSTMVLLAPIVSLVMLFIRGDLVLSLGLIGSLSIIRFRTPIKDTRDMVFLFWTIAVGLGCGTYNWMPVIISTLFISAVIVILYLLKYGRSVSSDYVLVVEGGSETSPELLENVISGFVEEIRLRSFESTQDQWEAVFELRYARATKKVDHRLVDELKEQKGVQKVSLLAPQLALPV